MRQESDHGHGHASEAQADRKKITVRIVSSNGAGYRHALFFRTARILHLLSLAAEGCGVQIMERMVHGVHLL
jgi:hypothetical protein